LVAEAGRDDLAIFVEHGVVVTRAGPRGRAATPKRPNDRQPAHNRHCKRAQSKEIKHGCLTNRIPKKPPRRSKTVTTAATLGLVLTSHHLLTRCFPRKVEP